MDSDKLEKVRGELARAVSLLDCIVLAMEHGEGESKGPYYPELVGMARDIVRKSNNDLDIVSLSRAKNGKQNPAK
jgi:hypothetical protein